MSSSSAVDGDIPHRKASRDLRSLRALTHPLRWRLIDLLSSEGSATATRCSEVLGENIASCAYHLSILAKYGYIEEAPNRMGRNKPWQLIDTEQDLSFEGLDAEGALAAEAAMEVFLDHELSRLKQRLRVAQLEPERWRPLVMGETTVLTADEMHAVKAEISRLFQQYEERLRDRTLRPEDGREVRFFAAISTAPSTPLHRSESGQNTSEVLRAEPDSTYLSSPRAESSDSDSF